jgi:hypothetical protein
VGVFTARQRAGRSPPRADGTSFASSVFARQRNSLWTVLLTTTKATTTSLLVLVLVVLVLVLVSGP